jgi:hypothetical protein
MPNSGRKKARCGAGLAAFCAFQCLALPDIKSFPLNNDTTKKINQINGLRACKSSV